MTAVTGETGAGKTMLVEALELLVGGRADATIVRPGAAEARVDGRFVDGDDELVLTRVVPADGRSRAYVDGRPATVGALAEAAAGLVDLHGQHDHQSLLAGPDAARRARPLRRRRPRAAARRAGPADRARRRAGRARRRRRGSGRGRSTCCASRSTSSTAAALDDVDEEARLQASRGRCSPTPSATARPAPPPTTALADDGGARDAVAAALAALTGRAPFRSRRRPAGGAARRARRRRRRAPRRRPRGSRRTRSGWPPCASAASCCATCAASTATTSPR